MEDDLKKNGKQTNQPKSIHLVIFITSLFMQLTVEFKASPYGEHPCCARICHCFAHALLILVKCRVVNIGICYPDKKPEYH